MAELKEISGSYDNPEALGNVLKYIVNFQKILYGSVYGGAVDPEHALQQIQILKECYGKTEGRRIRHFVLSFGPKDRIDEDDAIFLCREIALYCGARFQCVCGTHFNTNNWHLHFMTNTVSYLDGRRYSASYSFLNELKTLILGYYPKLKIFTHVEAAERPGMFEYIYKKY